MAAMKEHEINKYWARVINTMNDALMIISKEGIILAVNQSFEEMTGYTAEEITGKPCTLLECDACEKAINNHSGAWCKLFENDRQDIRKCRCEIKKKDGTYLPALKNASVLHDEKDLTLGAVETLTDISEVARLDEKVERLSRQLDSDHGYNGIIGSSIEMKNVFDIIEKAAQGDAPIIILGESGTGKELVARAIHERGKRRNGPFVQLNCAALNESLLESELFGHVKGSFTGAHRDRRGRFEAANGGDLFLDEIGDIPLSLQIKLLRVLETKQFERVGDDRPISTDVRIITATNKNLIELISQKKFREDLYFRINVIPIQLPPLRERKEDIPLLLNTFMDRLKLRTDKPISGFSKNAIDSLMNYSWPGNIREMKSTLEYAFTIADKGHIDCRHLPAPLQNTTCAKSELPDHEPSDRSEEKQALINALRETNGNQTRAAALLGVNRVTVWNRMRKYQINLKREINS